MNVNDYIARGLAQSLDMLKMHLNDLSDAELLMRPVPSANHANWQIGHLIAAEVHLLSQCGAPMPELPAGFADRYSKEASKIDDPAKFANKADLLTQFDRIRNAEINWTKTLTTAQLDAPSPMPQWFPTVADIVGLGPVHIAMHVGQIQVLRRKLGKPILM